MGAVHGVVAAHERQTKTGVSAMFEPADEEYRTCGERGADCEPEPFDAGEGQGVRIALACPTHGVHSVVDPFEGKR